MAAMISNETIVIREQAIKTIVDIKWNEEQLLLSTQSNNLAVQCSTAIKKHVHSLIKKDKFKTIHQHVTHNVLYHELGHGVIQHNLLQTEIAAFAEAFENIEESVFECILEILADFAPQQDNISGIFSSLVNISKLDIRKLNSYFGFILVMSGFMILTSKPCMITVMRCYYYYLAT